MEGRVRRARQALMTARHAFELRPINGSTRRVVRPGHVTDASRVVPRAPVPRRASPPRMQHVPAVLVRSCESSVQRAIGSPALFLYFLTLISTQPTGRMAPIVLRSEAMRARTQYIP